MKHFAFCATIFIMCTSFMTNDESALNQVNSVEVLEEARPIYYIDYALGPSDGHLVCCCAGGNQFTCDNGQSVQFSCIPGGPFDCDRELSDGGVVQDCSDCCPFGGCA